MSSQIIHVRFVWPSDVRCLGLAITRISTKIPGRYTVLILSSDESKRRRKDWKIGSKDPKRCWWNRWTESLEPGMQRFGVCLFYLPWYVETSRVVKNGLIIVVAFGMNLHWWSRYTHLFFFQFQPWMCVCVSGCADRAPAKGFPSW